MEINKQPMCIHGNTRHGNVLFNPLDYGICPLGQIIPHIQHTHLVHIHCTTFEHTTIKRMTLSLLQNEVILTEYTM